MQRRASAAAPNTRGQDGYCESRNRRPEKMCEACEAAKAGRGDVRIPANTDRREVVLDYKLSGQSQHVKHFIDPGHLLLRYNLPRTVPKVTCNYEGGHPHWNGVIGRARCGLLLQLGHRCASNSVANWAEVIGYVKDERAKDDARAAVREARDLLPQCRELAALGEATGRRMRGDFVWRDSALRIPQRFAARTRTVNVEGKRREVEDAVVIRGTSIWRQAKLPVDCSKRIGALEGLARRDLDAEMSPLEARRITRELHEATRYFGELAQWLGEARLFFGKENLVNVMKWHVHTARAAVTPYKERGSAG